MPKISNQKNQTKNQTLLKTLITGILEQSSIEFAQLKQLPADANISTIDSQADYVLFQLIEKKHIWLALTKQPFNSQQISSLSNYLLQKESEKDYINTLKETSDTHYQTLIKEVLGRLKTQVRDSLRTLEEDESFSGSYIDETELENMTILSIESSNDETQKVLIKRLLEEQAKPDQQIIEQPLSEPENIQHVIRKCLKGIVVNKARQFLTLLSNELTLLTTTPNQFSNELKFIKNEQNDNFEYFIPSKKDFFELLLNHLQQEIDDFLQPYQTTTLTQQSPKLEKKLKELLEKSISYQDELAQSIINDLPLDIYRNFEAQQGNTAIAPIKNNIYRGMHALVNDYTHENQEFKAYLDTNPQLELSIKKYVGMLDLIKTLQTTDKSPQEQWQDFNTEYRHKTHPILIQYNNKPDTATLRFLKVVAAILTLGLTAALGLWKPKPDNKMDKTIAAMIKPEEPDQPTQPPAPMPFRFN